MAFEKYHFERNGEVYAIPNLRDIPIGVIRKARKLDNEMDVTFSILETVLGDGSPELDALDGMTADDFQKFMEGWQQGAPLGESSSSSS